MKNLLILAMLITGIAKAQCNLEIFDECPSIEFEFSTEECAKNYNILYSDEIDEIEDIVDLFFTELATYNEGIAHYPAYLYPYIDVVSSTFTTKIDFYPFTGSLTGRAASANTCNGNLIHIEVNSKKWFTEVANEEVKPDGTTYYNNQNNPVIIRLKKKFLIYHELGHIVLGLDHNCNSQVNDQADIMKTSQCARGNGSTALLSWPYDFPVFQDNDFYNSAKRMWQKVDQVDLPDCN